MNRVILTCLTIASTLFAPYWVPSSFAQVSFGNDQPIDVVAKRATYKGAKTILRGNVKVVQGTATIFADQMDLFRAQKTNQEPQTTATFKLGNINRIVAVGNFKYITPENSVSGDKGVYERDKEIITVTGNAKFVQSNGDTVTGNRMIYDLTTNRAKVDGRCSGRNCKKNDRVEINIAAKN